MKGSSLTCKVAVWSRGDRVSYLPDAGFLGERGSPEAPATPSWGLGVRAWG